MTRAEIIAKRIELFESKQIKAETLELEQIKSSRSNILYSTRTITSRLNCRMDMLRPLLQERIRLEKEIPLAPENEATWYQQLVDDINAIVDRRLAVVLGGITNDIEWLNRRNAKKHIFRKVFGTNPHVTWARDTSEYTRSRYLAEAEVMQGERQHQKKISPHSNSNIVVNINNSTVASLNVASVVRDIQATVNTLNTTGKENIAERLKALAEAIGNATESELDGTTKREALEHVSVLGEELSRTERRPGVLRSIGTGLNSMLSRTTHVNAAYQLLKTAIKASTDIDLP